MLLIRKSITWLQSVVKVDCIVTDKCASSNSNSGIPEITVRQKTPFLPYSNHCSAAAKQSHRLIPYFVSVLAQKSDPIQPAHEKMKNPTNPTQPRVDPTDVKDLSHL